MSERGVFAVDRGIWSDPDFADETFSEREAFLWLVGSAAWRPSRVRLGSAVVDLARGQCAFSTRFMAQKWKWSEARVRRYLGRLKDAGIIDAVADAHGTRINICKYDRFQRVSLPSDALGDAEATQARRTDDAGATHQRRKEEDRESRETGNSSSLRSERRARKPKKPVTPIAEDAPLTDAGFAFAVDRGIPPSEVGTEWERFVSHHVKHGTEFADWPAAWRTWVLHPLRNKPPNGNGPRGHPAPRPSARDDWAADAITSHESLMRKRDEQRGFSFDEGRPSGADDPCWRVASEGVRERATGELVVLQHHGNTGRRRALG